MKTLAELEEIRKSTYDKINLVGENDEVRVVVGLATCGIAAGAKPVMAAFAEEVKKHGLANVSVVQTGCIGVCRLEPIAEVYTKGKEKVTYVRVEPEMVSKIVENHIINGKPVVEYTIGYAEAESR